VGVGEGVLVGEGNGEGVKVGVADRLRAREGGVGEAGGNVAG